LLAETSTLDPTKEEDREAFFLRALKRCIFSAGNAVRIPGTQRKGRVTAIIRDFKDVVWKDNNAFFVEVEWRDNGEKTVCTPSQLTLKRAK